MNWRVQPKINKKPRRRGGFNGTTGERFGLFTFLSKGPVKY